VVYVRVDYITAPLETKAFGEQLPIDALQLIGTLPNTNNLKEMKKLYNSMMKKSVPTVDSESIAEFILAVVE